MALNASTPAVEHAPTRSISRIVEALLDSFIVPVSRPAELESHPAAVNRVLDWLGRSLDVDPARRISLPELATVGAVTPKHLCRLFATSVGRSPMETVRLSSPGRAPRVARGSGPAVEPAHISVVSLEPAGR